jgi:hypothetical protein
VIVAGPHDTLALREVGVRLLVAGVDERVVGQLRDESFVCGDSFAAVSSFIPSSDIASISCACTPSARDP